MSAFFSDTALSHWRWALVDGVGPLTFARLLERFGDAETAWRASAAELQHVEGIGSNKADRIARARGEPRWEEEAQAAEQHGLRVICRADAEYPPGLRFIPDAPIVLYVKGELRPTDAVALAVVGSRRCSVYGAEQARRFGELLASVGFTVISGLARGIDAFAQHGAVDVGGRSIAVIGNGLSEIYPPENRALADKLIEHGAWVSELPIRTAVRAGNFPARNRIIAGMSLGVLVVEAAARSGALITARFASEYNREVFAVPGRAQDATAMGTNDLIRKGAAKLVTCLEDILSEFGDVGRILTGLGVSGEVATAAAQRAASVHEESAPDAAEDAAANSGERSRFVPDLALNDAERQVLACLGDESSLQDAVLQAVALPTGEALAAFTSLELKGLVRRLPGQMIARRK